MPHLTAYWYIVQVLISSYTVLDRPITPSRPSCVQQDICALLPAREVRHVGVAGQRLRDLPAGLDLADLHEAVARLGDGLGDGVGALGLALGADDVGLAFLLGLLDDEARALGVLLRDLLLLDRLGELLAEGHVRDRDVLERDVELGRALHQVRPDPVRDGLTLGDQLGGIELRDDRLENFVADGGEHTLVVVIAEILKA